MLFRPHREYLDDSMKEVSPFSTWAELRKLLPSYVDPKGEIEFESQGMDNRIGWHSYLLSVDGKAVGHTNGKLS